MLIYQPSDAERAASHALLRVRFADEDAARIARGVDLVPALGYETTAERNAFWQATGLAIQPGSADPGFFFPSSDARRNVADPHDSTPRVYYSDGNKCQCWDSLITEGRCRHCYAVLAYRLIINAKLDSLAQAGRLDMRPAGRYAGLYDVVDCWGRTIAAAIYSAKLDKWRCENDEDVAGFAYWLTTDNQYATIGIERRGGDYVQGDY